MNDAPPQKPANARFAKCGLRRFLTLAGMAALVAFAIGLFLTKAAGLQGGKHTLASALGLTCVAALIGAMASAGGIRRLKRANLWRALALLAGLSVGALLVLDGAGLMTLPWAFLRFFQAALMGFALALFFNVLTRDLWLAALAAVLVFGLCTTLALWGDAFLSDRAVSSETLGAIGIRNSPALRLVYEGLGIEPFGGALYLERGFLIKDYAPVQYYSGVGWSWLCVLALMVLAWLGDTAIAALGRAWERFRMRRVGLDDASAPNASKVSS